MKSSESTKASALGIRSISQGNGSTTMPAVCIAMRAGSDRRWYRSGGMIGDSSPDRSLSENCRS